MPGRFEIVPAGPFELEQAVRFGFGPSPGRDDDGPAIMRLAFVVDGYHELAGVVLSQDADGRVIGEVSGARDLTAVRNQVARILSLDHDAAGWRKVGDRDQVIGRLQSAHPGFRPVLFHSTYEAAAWAIMAARRSTAQTRTLRRRVSEAIGEVFDLAGEPVAAFPSPARLAEIEPMQGLELKRVQRLHAVAAAALDGVLEPRVLRDVGPDEARRRVQTIPGIGPFYSGLIVHRAIGFADSIDIADPHTSAVVARTYGLSEPEREEIARISEAWRPFRNWAVALLRQAAHEHGQPLRVPDRRAAR